MLRMPCHVDSFRLLKFGFSCFDIPCDSVDSAPTSDWRCAPWSGEDSWSCRTWLRFNTMFDWKWMLSSSLLFVWLANSDNIPGDCFWPCSKRGLVWLLPRACCQFLNVYFKHIGTQPIRAWVMSILNPIFQRQIPSTSLSLFEPCCWWPANSWDVSDLEPIFQTHRLFQNGRLL